MLRALRQGDTRDVLLAELAVARGVHPALDRLLAVLPHRMEDMSTEVEARRLSQDIALAMQACLLCQTAPPAIFAAFCESRLAGDWGQVFGTLGRGVDLDAILVRARPQ